MKEKILISACLLGDKVRYDGVSKAISDRFLKLWQQQNRLVSICPEVAGGLGVPRDPAEIQLNGKVQTCHGDDVTNAFNIGAEKSLALCKQHGIKLALLKESSPSCGNNFIYNGSFEGTKITGQGLTARLLEKNNIRVFSENEINQLAAQIALIEN